MLAYWFSIFAAPLKEPEMFWILIPVWINWFFTEFFQEKYGTSFGNAVSNGAIAILASIDWFRYLLRLYTDGYLSITIGFFFKLLVAISVFAYGVFVIMAGIKIKIIVFYIGKIRWVTYILVMFTPIVYNVIKLNLYTLTAIILFFPLFYWVIEVFDRITPEPKLYKQSS
ncbi:hypothetical protein HYS31_06145 [Candidatus Woesearchaeota archaeon]|nr:hypothetical protein [Candidatus Woesearchaeota archaeon]